MTDSSSDTLERLRHALARALRVDASSLGADTELHVPSVGRLAILAEIESVFGLELSADAGPSLFDSVATLASAIEAELAERSGR